MENHNYSDRNSPNLNHYNRSYSRCCPPEYGCNRSCSCHQSRCRRDLCDDNFKIRLAGLQGGLMFRLRQLLGCKSEIELDNGTKIKGEIVFVGSNFVEMLVDETLPPIGNPVEEEIVESSQEVLQLDITSILNLLNEKIHANKENGIREHKKGETWIFSAEKIANILINSSYHQYKCNERNSF